MPDLSAVEVMVLVNEINGRLRGMYVNNVYSLRENQIVRLREEGRESWLILAPSIGAWVSEKIGERERTSEFTSKFRSFVGRKKFVYSEQVNFDRVYRFVFQDRERINVYLEVPPPGNIVVTDEDERIKLCLRNYVTASRKIVEGGVYTPPIQRRKKPEELKEEDIADFLKREKEVGSAIGKFVALPRKYVALVVKRLGITADAETSLLSGRESEVVKVVNGIIEEAKENTYPCIAQVEGEKEIFSVNVDSAEHKQSISEICDELFLPLIVASEEKSRKKEELQHTLSRLMEEALEIERKASHLREVAARIRNALTTEEAETILKEEKLDSEFNARKEPASLSSLIFDMAKELENKRKQVMKTIESISLKLEREEVSEKRKQIQIRKARKEWFERFRWFITSEGKLAIGGRDASSNTVLMRKHLEERDTVYHADIHGSPFFILKDGINQKENEIIEVAQATASYSSAWKVGLSAADAFWVESRQVSFSAPSGQYLPKGSFLIKGRKNYVRHILLQIAVGINKEGKVIAGPETAISKYSLCYVVIEPFRTKNSEVAKKIASFFRDVVRDFDVSVDEVLLSLPPGGSRIVRKKNLASEVQS